MASTSYPSARTWVNGSGVFAAADGNRIEGGVLLAHERLDTAAVNPYATILTPSGVDQTAEIKNAIAAAVTASITRGDRYAEVVFTPGVYLINGTPTVGGGTAGDAQIPLPIISDDDPKVTLALRGIVDASATYHWEQDGASLQLSGACLKSNYQGPSSVPASGGTSIIGGPTPNNGYGSGGPLFSNMLVVVDGLLLAPAQGDRVCGFDFRGLAQANVVSAAVLAQRSTAGAPPVPAPTWGFGLAMPEANNNDNNNIGNLSVQGMVDGVRFYEHVQVNTMRMINCYNGIVFGSISGFPHHNLIGYASVEACERGVVNIGFAKVTFSCLNLELPNGEIIRDPGNFMWGTVNISVNGDGTALLAQLNGSGVNGATNVRILHENGRTGAVIAPSVPATTVALRNPFWRDAAVCITGGTVTGIAVDGQATGLTAGTVFVPSGRTITLTYSSAPTWHWTLL